MGQHAVTFEGTTAAGACLGAIVSDGNVLPQIVDIRIGFRSVPDDERYVFGLYEISNAGAGGSDQDTKRIGPTSPTACVAKSGFSTQPTKAGARMLAMCPHRRNTEVEKRASGQGFKPTAIAENRGLGIFCDVAPGAIDAVITIVFED